MMKKLTILTSGLLVMLTLTACGSQSTPASQSSSHARATHEKITGKSTAASSKSATKHQAKTTASTLAKQSAPTTSNQAMNLTQVKRGDYSQLVGVWQQVATTYNRQDGHGMHYKMGGDHVLSVSKQTITDGNVSLRGDQFTDGDATKHAVEFKADQGGQVALLRDAAKIGVNWSVTFYPKGSTSAIKLNADSKKNTENLIAIWDSGDQYTAIYAQPTAKTTATQLNLAQLSDNDFSSLVGRWKNPAGKVVTVTNRTQQRPKDSALALKVGAVTQNKASDGSDNVIGTDMLRDGLIQGSYGSFSGQSMDPLLIVPAGIKATKGDDSHTTKDRLIMGGGQGGYANEAYYRQ